MTSRWTGASAIVGIGATEFSRESGRSEMRLAMEAITAAIADAGIDPAEVDGMCTYAMENNPESELHRLIGGRELRYFSRVEYGGGGACAPFLQAALAIAAGVAEVVVVYRAMNERSWYRFGGGIALQQAPTYYNANHLSWCLPAGLNTPAAFIALPATAYMARYGATSEDFGRVAVAARDFAATNPKAFFHGKPLTLAEHQQSRMIAEPLRLFDCCQESDGAVAVVLTSAARARDLRQPPVAVSAAAQGCVGEQRMTGFYHGDMCTLPGMALVGRQLYEQSGLRPQDIDCAVLYDHFTPFVLLQLEALGFCAQGEAPDFVRRGAHARGGQLPVNPNGGQLGEAYIHGLNGVAEAVRQLRGTAVNQVPGARHVMVTGGSGLPTSGIILGAGD